MRNKKATKDDNVPGYVLKLLGEDGLKIITKLIKNTYETGDQPKDFTEVTMTPLNKKPKLQNAQSASSHIHQRQQ
jgi:hypothetical protein